MTERQQPRENLNLGMMPKIKFEDIQSTFKEFRGETSQNIETWIDNFESQCNAFELTMLQKFIFARKLLKGNASLFLEYESKATSWYALKAELKIEFERKNNSATIHEKLRLRRKRQTETCFEFLYEILKIAEEATIETKAIISYVIDGLPGSFEMKAHMYDANTISELKTKLLTYEALQQKYRPQRRERYERNEKINQRNEPQKKENRFATIVVINRIFRHNALTEVRDQNVSNASVLATNLQTV